MAEPFGSKFRAAASRSSKQCEIFHNSVSDFMTVFEDGISYRNIRFSYSFRNYHCVRTAVPAVEMRMERAVSGGRDSRHRRDAVDRICGNALFYNVLQGFSVNSRKVRSIGI